MFNQFGMLERCARRNGNVRADGWRDVLDPVIARYAAAATLVDASSGPTLPTRSRDLYAAGRSQVLLRHPSARQRRLAREDRRIG
ncbi:MAG: hypothetical protein R3D84_12685 [Paracoccaceae bacterium]